MTRTRIVYGQNRVMLHALLCAVLLGILAPTFAQAKNSAWSPWHKKSSAIVIDAYTYTPIDWSKLRSNKRLVGFINKASDGLVEPWRCGGTELKRKLCTVVWRRYKAEHELFLTRRHLAKALGLKWGSYHLARPGNPVQQALHYIQYADPQPDDLISLDIEHNDPKKWMSLKDAETFARVIKRKLGRYPLLYTNHDTAKYIARNRDKYKLLSRLNLWYARYKDRIPGVFPLGNWTEYTMWQFSSMHNCSKRRCLFRVKGTDSTIDVNVSSKSVATTRKLWPFNELTAKVRPVKKQPLLVSYAPEEVKPTSAALAAIGNLLSPKTLEAIIPTQIVQEKAAALIARRIELNVDEVIVAAVAPVAAEVKTQPVHIPEVRLPRISMSDYADQMTLLNAGNAAVSQADTAGETEIVTITAKATNPMQAAPYRSLDSAPKFVPAPKPIAEWRTSDEIRQQMMAR